MAVGKEIKRLRGNVSTLKAANLIGVDVERLRKWEQRDADPKDYDDIKRVEDFFGVPLSGLTKLDKFRWSKNIESKVSEAEPNYGTIRSLADSNRVMADSNKVLSEANRTLADAHKILADAHDRIVRGNEKLINLLEISFHKSSSVDPALLHPAEPIQTSAEKELLQTGHTGPFENRRKKGPVGSSNKKDT